MSDKEERLYIVRYPSRLIPEATGITVTRKKFNSKSFARSEAVERMANVFYDFCEGCKTYEEYERLAEAALDALVDK